MRIPSLILASAIAVLPAIAGPLDEPLHVVSEDDALRQLAGLRDKLAPYEASDFSWALLRIGRETDEHFSPDLTVGERQQLFVALTDNHTPRQIILEAAAIARARSFGKTEEKKAPEMSPGEQEFFRTLQSISSYAVRKYSNPKTEANQPPLRMPVSGTPAADAPVAPPPGIAGR